MPVSFHFLDVGMGDSTFIIGPGGENILVDFGSTKNRRLVRRDSITFLKRELERRDPPKLELLVLTHADQDHYNQLKFLFQEVDNLEVDRVIYSGNAESYSTTNFYRDHLEGWVDDGTALAPAEAYSNTLAGGANFQYGGLKIWIIGANYLSLETESNTQSIVLLCRFAGRKVILPGDATAVTELKILEAFDGRLGDLSSDVLKLPHHGSFTSSSNAFIAAVSPEIITVSADTNPGYGLPKCEVISRYASHLGQSVDHNYVCYDPLATQPEDRFVVKDTDKDIYGSLVSLLQGVQYEIRIADDGSMNIRTTD